MLGNHDVPETDHVSEGSTCEVTGTQGDEVPESTPKTIAPIDAGKALLIGMFLPSFIARGLGMSGYWLQVVGALGFR